MSVASGPRLTSLSMMNLLLPRTCFSHCLIRPMPCFLLKNPLSTWFHILHRRGPNYTHIVFCVFLLILGCHPKLFSFKSAPSYQNTGDATAFCHYSVSTTREIHSIRYNAATKCPFACCPSIRLSHSVCRHSRLVSISVLFRLFSHFFLATCARLS